MGEQRAKRIVVVISDQQRWDTLPCNGNTFTQAPHSTRIAKAGVNFANATTPFPVCTPARASMWTGLRPFEHGVLHNRYGVNDVLDRDSAKARTIFEDFRDGGWTVAYFGKWHLGEANVDRFDYWDGFNSRGGHWKDGKQSFQGGVWKADETTENLIAWLGSRAENATPTLAVISYYPPHNPFTAPPEFYAPYRGKGVPHAGYYAAVDGIDACLGRILDAVDDETLVFFLSDHGETFDLHAERPHKFCCLDPAIRVPFLMCGPGTPNGANLDSPISLLDLPPTLLDTAGLKIPGDMAGRSLWDLIDGADDWRDYAYIENETLLSHTIERALRTKRWKLILNAAEQHALYDMENDPEEVLNLWGSPKVDIHDQYHHFDTHDVEAHLVEQMGKIAGSMGDNAGAELAARSARQIAADRPGYRRARAI